MSLTASIAATTAQANGSVPKHVAIIMDGNGRWAQGLGKERVFGHRNALQSVRDTTEAAADAGVQYVTLYTFSTENWSRPEAEVQALMQLLVEAAQSELPTLEKNNVRLSAIGDLSALPESTRAGLQKTMDLTANNSRVVLTLALNYSGRWEMWEAAKKMAEAARRDPQLKLTPENFDGYLASRHLPDPDLMIRTGGEQRISNFMLWQMAYTEFHFTDVLWPDFRKADFEQALSVYAQRQRRFGRVL